MQKLIQYCLVGGSVFLALAGCAPQPHEAEQNPHLAPGTETGTFCQRLAHVLVRGTENWLNKGYFAALEGNRIDDDRFYGTVNIGGASECVIDSYINKYDVHYTCYYGQATEAQRGVLVKKMNELETAVDRCLVQQNIFHYSENGVAKPRYSNGRREYDKVTFNDRWRGQNVTIRIESVEQDENMSELTLRVDSL